MSDISEIIKSSIESVKAFTDVDTVIGRVITTQSGVTVIPISKLTVGFFGGGLDYGQKKLSHMQNFGGGSGTGISVSPIAFLTISPDASINLIPISNESDRTDRLFSLIERSPEIIERIKRSLS